MFIELVVIPYYMSHYPTLIHRGALGAVATAYC